MAVDTDKLLVVFQGNKSPLVGAKGSGLIVRGVGLDKKSGVIDDIAQILHDVIVDFHPDTHFNAPLAYINAVFLGNRGHPVGADPARGQDDIGGLILPLVRDNPLNPALLFNNINYFFRCNYNDLA